LTFKKIKCCLVGLGRSAERHHLPILLKHPYFEISGCITRSDERWRIRQAQLPNTKRWKTIQQFLSEKLFFEDRPALIILCTPPEGHVSQAMPLLMKKYSVLIEKPLTLNFREARLLYRTAKKFKSHVFTFHNRHYDGEIIFLKKIIGEKKLGRIFHVELHYFKSYGPSWGNYGVTPWRVTRKSGGVLLDFGPHFFEQILQLFPEGIQKVSAQLFKEGNFKKVDDHDFIQLETKSGVHVHVYFSNHCAAPLPQWYVSGRRGALRSCDNGRQGWNAFDFFYRQGEAVHKHRLSFVRTKNRDQLFYDDLARYLCGEKREPPVSSESAMKVMQLIDAAFLADRLGRPIKL